VSPRRSEKMFLSAFSSDVSPVSYRSPVKSIFRKFRNPSFSDASKSRYLLFGRSTPSTSKTTRRGFVNGCGPRG